ELLDRTRPSTLFVVHTSTVGLVSAFTLPGEDWIVLELIEPAAHQRIANLDLVVKKAEGQDPVHRLDPEGEASQLDRERIDVHAVETPLDAVSPEPGVQVALRLVGLEWHVPHRLEEPWRPTVSSDDGQVPVLASEPPVVEQARVEGAGEKAKARHQERCRAHG